jgi:hypothetical protein
LGLKLAINKFRPSVDPGLYKIDFIPVVLKEGKHNGEVSVNTSGEIPSLYVIRISVEKGIYPVYFTSQERL